ncbi:MAG: DinB family protein [Arachnia sp.]
MDSTVERQDLLETLTKHRHFLRLTVENLTDEQAARVPTVSALALNGLIKHVADTEDDWARFMVHGAAAEEDSGEDQDWTANGEEPGDGQGAGRDPRFVVDSGTTLADLIRHYEEVAARTDALISTVDLDSSHPLPPAPWFEPGTRWTARRVLLHIIAETAQHAGHADIIRESIDGAKSMG